MRTLVVFSGHPWLYRCAQWEYVKLLVKTNAHRGYFYVVVPDTAVVQENLPNTTILRSNTDSGYFYYRDVGSFANVNDGQFVIDSAITFVGEMACGLDLQINSHSFEKPTHHVPVVVWHHMFHAVKNEKWRRATTLYPSLYGSKRDYEEYRKYVVGSFKPTKAKEIMDTAGVVTLCGKDLRGMAEKAKGVKKYSRPTLLFGCRFNAWHHPEDSLAIIENAHRLGVDFDLKITTPDASIDEKYVKQIHGMGGEITYSCGQAQFHDILMRSHAGLIVGEAASPVYIPEYVCGGTIVIADHPHYDFPEITSLQKPYPYVFKTASQAVGLIKKVFGNLDNEYKFFNAQNYPEQMFDSLDQETSSKAIFDFAAKWPPMYEKRRRGGIGNYRAARMAAQLASTGGEATLSELIVRLEASGGIVRDKQIGRWITRKLVHDLMVSNPAIVDLCDGPEPKYKMDFALYREWVKTKGDGQEKLM